MSLSKKLSGNKVKKVSKKTKVSIKTKVSKKKSQTKTDKLKQLKVILKENTKYFNKNERKEYLKFAMKNSSKYLKKYGKTGKEGNPIHSLTKIASMLAQDFTFEKNLTFKAMFKQ